MSFKALIFFGLLAVALGFTLPEDGFDGPEPQWMYEEPMPEDYSLDLVRRARSPQGSFGANVGHSRQMGTSAGIDYTRRINKNWEAYAGASRNFKFNDNSGHAGLRYRF